MIDYTEDVKMMTSSSSDEKLPEIKCTSGSIVLISKLTANYPLIPRNELVVQEQLGAGSYGFVFKGVWNVKKVSKPLVVALKKVFMLEREVAFFIYFIEYKLQI